MLTSISDVRLIKHIKKYGNSDIVDNIVFNFHISEHLSICISIRKSFGNAVQRNQMKRRIKNIISLLNFPHINLVIQINRKKYYSYDHIFYIMLASLARINKYIITQEE